MSIPLVQKAEKDDINTSIIAIKRNIERINMLLGLSNSEEIDTSMFATKDELQQAVTDLQPVDEVTVDNMQSVTSNAVATALSGKVYHTNLTSTGKIDGSNTTINWEIFCIENDIAICFGTNAESKAISSYGAVQFVLPNGYHAYGSAHFYFYGNIFLDADPGNATGAIHNITNGMLIYSTKAGNVSAGSARCIMIAQKDR